eukprot:5227680-Alexandrium_andersonii.AAC.1
MSASLVGSEMCIRDRRNRGRLVGARQNDLRGRERRRRRVSAFSVRSTVAVSYTHLTLPTICSV